MSRDREAGEGDAETPDAGESAGDADFEPDAERRARLRDIADDVYGDTSESRQVAAILYRVSDLYDPDEDTSPEEIHRNVRHILNVKAEGGLRTE